MEELENELRGDHNMKIYLEDNFEEAIMLHNFNEWVPFNPLVRGSNFPNVNFNPMQRYPKIKYCSLKL